MVWTKQLYCLNMSYLLRYCKNSMLKKVQTKQVLCMNITVYNYKNITVSNYRVWDTHSWTPERWCARGCRVVSACWGPNDVVLFAAKGEPMVYALSNTGLLNGDYISTYKNDNFAGCRFDSHMRQAFVRSKHKCVRSRCLFQQCEPLR